MTKKLKSTYLILAAAVLFFSVCMFALREAHAGTQTDVTLSAQGDEISSFGVTFTAEDSFVYTARARFSDGQAAGVAFGIDGDGAFVLNVDRKDNRTKLIYFSETEEGLSAQVLAEDYYIGNANSTDEELARVQSRVAEKGEFYLKVAITGGAEPSVKCYVDDILRFCFDGALSLNSLAGGVVYDGGAIGLNVYNATAEFGEIYYGEGDFTHYTELYRNQYHYSQFSGWNNDPNGLVFDGEYYHLYFQTQPFQKTWGDMYWGHARSRDLLHWENLPIALLPTDGSFMWSGSAIIDKDNVSGLFDSLESPEYDGSANILIYYTADGGPDQDQWMAYSLDGGISFIKHKCIIDGATVENGITFRDPKVFEVEEGVWGIIVGGGRFRFYVSTDLVNWTLSSQTPVYAECPDVYKLPADGGEKWVINVSGIAYIVGDLSYENGKIKFVDQFGVELTDPATEAADVKVFDLDNANGSYATQTFYIDSENSAYNGRVVGVSWFAGQPGYQPPMDGHEWVFGEQAVGPDTGAQANNRSIWNCGFTFPVEYSLKNVGGTYLLRLTPISADSISEEIFRAEGTTVKEGENILAGVSGNTLRITAEVKTEADKFGFRVFIGEDEYTEVGFDKENGYYLDRRHTSSGNTVIANYSGLYATGIHDFVRADGVYDFTILLDRGSLEMFCEDFTQAFYANTYAGYYSDGLEFFVEGGTAEVNVAIEETASVYREESGEAKLTLSAESAELDTLITDETEISAYVSGEGTLQWSAADEGIVAVEPTENGAKLTAVGSGQTEITVTLLGADGEALDRKTLEVSVLQGDASTSNLTFKKEGITAGGWHSQAEGISGEMTGDGFILAEETAGDFTLETTVSVAGAEAAALIFRADENMDFYYAANYDRKQGIVKVWSAERSFIEKSVGVYDEVTLRVKAEGNTFTYYFNGSLAGSFTDENAPESGLLGLNVFNGRALFRSVKYFAAHSGDYEFGGGDVTLYLSSDSYVEELFDFTLGNTLVSREFYRQNGNELVLSAAYLNTLREGRHAFVAVSESGTDEFVINVKSSLPAVGDVTLDILSDVHVNIGSSEVTGVEVNGAAVSGYEVQNGVLTIGAETLVGGVNAVTVIFGEDRVTFSVIAPETHEEAPPTKKAGWGDVLFYVVGGIEAALIAAVLAFVVVKRTRAKKEK